MIDLTDSPGRLAQMISIVALYYWSGFVNGEALAAIFHKTFKSFLDRYKYPYLIFFLMFLPFHVLPNIAAGFLMQEPVDRRILFDTLFLVPVWVGVIAGICNALVSSNALKQIVQFAPAIITAVIVVAMAPFMSTWLSDYNTSYSNVVPVAIGAITVTSIFVLLNAGQMLYGTNRLAEIVITEIPVDTGTRDLREIFHLLKQDAEILDAVPKHKHIAPWKSVHFPGRKTGAFAVYSKDALYLRISGGLNAEPPAFTFKIVPRKIIWAKINWENVSKISEDKIVGYHETHIVLPKSGLVIALPGNSPMLTNLPVAKAAEAFNATGVPAQ